MSFELSQTPTLEAVATDDELALARDVQARTSEAVSQIEMIPEVAEAIASARRAADQLSKLRTAERSLNQTAKDARAKLDNSAQTALDGLIEAAASGTKPEWKKAVEAAGLEDQLRYAGRAIERLTEHLIPLANIANLREEAHALVAQARALEHVAKERAQKVLGQIRAAVSDEMVLPVDMSKGVAGALLSRARQMKERAVQLTTEADQWEQKYQDRA